MGAIRTAREVESSAGILSFTHEHLVANRRRSSIRIELVHPFSCFVFDDEKTDFMGVRLRRRLFERSGFYRRKMLFVERGFGAAADLGERTVARRGGLAAISSRHSVA